MMKFNINYLIGHDNKIQKRAIVDNGSQSKDVRCLSLTKVKICLLSSLYKKLKFALIILILLMLQCAGNMYAQDKCKKCQGKGVSVCDMCDYFARESRECTFCCGNKIGRCSECVGYGEIYYDTECKFCGCTDIIKCFCNMPYYSCDKDQPKREECYYCKGNGFRKCFLCEEYTCEKKQNSNQVPSHKEPTKDTKSGNTGGSKSSGGYVEETCSVCYGRGSTSVESICQSCKGTRKNLYAKQYPPLFGHPCTKEVCYVCNSFECTHAHSPCYTCNASGKVQSSSYCYSCGWNGSVRSNTSCYTCGGSGKVIKYKP